MKSSKKIGKGFLPPQESSGVGNPYFSQSSIDTGKLYLDVILGRHYLETFMTHTSYWVADDVGFERKQGAFMRFLIKTPTEPEVFLEDQTTPAIKIAGADFKPNTLMEMVVQATYEDSVEYFFLDR